LAFFVAAAASATAEPESRLRNRDHRHRATLDGLAENRRGLRPLADRLADLLEEVIHEL
jgi:hypothetical protein